MEGMVVLYKSIYKRTYSLWFLAPSVIIYYSLFVFPFLLGVYYSFTDWNFKTASFIGLENYKNILMRKELNIAVKNTLIFALVTAVLKSILGLGLAVVLNRQLRSRNFLRTIFFMPAVINNIAIGIIFVAILHPVTGLLNRFFNAIGATFLAQNWLTDTKLAIYSISMIEVWKWTGFTMVIFLAGLQSISNEYYEVANIDGANAWQKFIKVTVPLIMPAINNAVVLNIIGGLSVFDIVLATTGGGPGRATEVLNTTIYKAYSQLRYGEACAGSSLLSFAIGIIAILVYLFIRKREVEV